MSTKESRRERKVYGTTLRSLLLIAAMFAFAFALVPLYNVFCDLTGLNGRSSKLVTQAQMDEPVVDTSRQVRLQFLATNNKGMPWRFHPNEKEMLVYPGRIYTATYHAANPTGHDMRAQAVPSVSPARAASYLRKLECFCFQSQFLAAGASQDMPVRFYVHNALPRDVATLTLSYTMFDIGGMPGHTEKGGAHIDLPGAEKPDGDAAAGRPSDERDDDGYNH